MMIAKQFYLFLLVHVAYSRLDPQAAFALISHHTRVFPTKYYSLFKIRHSKSALFYVQETISTGETESGDDNSETRPEAESQDKAWMQATRTLGSLFLHQEDAARGYENKTDVGVDSEPFPFHESSLSSYLLNLKRQEEVNREKSSELLKEKNRKERNISTSGKPLTDFHIDQKTAKEIDENVVDLPLDGLLDDLEVLPQNGEEVHVAKTSPLRDVLQLTDFLRLNHPEHYEKRLGRDMRHLGVSIAASIDKPWQWKLFFDEGGGVLPLLECIRDGARSVEKGKADFIGGDADGTAILTEQYEASFAAACTACRALRDLSALSKDFSAVVTDDILKVNDQWSTCVVEGEGYDCSSGGLVSDLLFLLKYANEGGRRRRRRQCGLYVIQLMLSMAIASDKAVATLRSTSGLIEEINHCSSYAPSERSKRKWIHKPIDFFKKKILLRHRTNSDAGIKASMQENSNKLLAALGHNIWVPKQSGQRGLRILCLDGGGTRGIAAVTSINHIVKAMGGIEVCDAFDMIVGTSTGAIVAFLVGLRRESAAAARSRYDTLISRIFVTSLLKPIMLATTTASYDEGNLMEVLDEILKDDGMLDSRANPRVPLITAVSSKMSSTPSQLYLLRNYNYGGGELPDSFLIKPDKARERLGLDTEITNQFLPDPIITPKTPIKCAPRTGMGSRYPGSFRVTQKVALRATTAAPTFFKPLLSFDELYCDGGIVASNPAAVAVHEARTIFPDVPLELIVSVGTGVFNEVKIPPRVGWDGVVSQILDSATDAEQIHHVLEDIFGDGRNARHGARMGGTKYFRFNAVVGDPDSFPIDETDPRRLQDLCDIVDRYMAEEDQQRKLQQLGDVVNPKRKVNTKKGDT